MNLRPLSPGVSIQFLNNTLHPVSPVSTSIAAFIGYAKTGPINLAVKTHNYTEYERHFGGLADNSEMSYALRQFFLNGGQEAWVVRISDSDQDLDNYNHFLGSEADETGLFALNPVDLINILCLPGVTNPVILFAAEIYCRTKRAFLIVDTPQGVSANDLAARITDYPKSTGVALYYPWLKIPDPLQNGRLRLTSTVGTVAGIYAATDDRSGVWKSPAGTEARLSGVQDLEFNLTHADNRKLNGLHINCLRMFTRTGPVVWGSRTSLMLENEYKYIPVKRLALFLEESLHRGIQWVAFEPNNEALWSRITVDVNNFMHSLFRQGAFAGNKASEAYFVRCDHSTISQSDILNQRVNIQIGFAALKPAEFIVLHIQNKTQ